MGWEQDCKSIFTLLLSQKHRLHLSAVMTGNRALCRGLLCKVIVSCGMEKEPGNSCARPKTLKIQLLKDEMRECTHILGFVCQVQEPSLYLWELPSTSFTRLGFWKPCWYYRPFPLGHRWFYSGWGSTIPSPRKCELGSKKSLSLWILEL